MCIDFIRDAKLAIHGSTGAQLFDFENNFNNYSGSGVSVINNSDGSFTVTGTPENYINIKSVEMELPPGYYYFSNNSSPLQKNAIFQIILNRPSGVEFCIDRGFYVDTDVTKITINFRVSPSSNSINATLKPMVNSGKIQIPWQPYTGGTPYTDKYTSSIKSQSESEVTLSIENVSASVGDRTELDVVLTDKNDITQRSEVGKTFIGGGQS